MPCHRRKLGAWTRGGLSPRQSAQIDAHLDDCDKCRAAAAELADVNAALRGIVAPLVLGAGAAGYRAATAKAKASAAAAALTKPVLLGAAASVLVIAVAVGIGTIGPSSPAGTPTAAASAPASTSTAGIPTTPARAGSSAPTSTGAATPVTTGEPGATAPAATAAAPPATAPTLVATAPNGFTMSTGGPPTEFPITIRNTGSAPAAPMTLTLSLPDDVKVVGPGNPPAGSVGCPAGAGTVTCTATQQLAPGASVRFVFRLLAGPKSTADGIITATTGAVRLDVPITITRKK
ncbi:zf-HC2 domain-containing protein [Amycolatopsis sp. H6(2020)]|nr:zf-HC2 domain-containing protein [Amycolatopsis sp. H6(2020)]